ncbi:MAG: hypothetical protein HYZ26_12450 [Chloroflexi bacterium]|nr:hypothetical protein [Chloroflexota bacterium]
MRPVFDWRVILHLIVLALAAPWQQGENSARILTPVSGEALQGLVAVEGDALGPDFSNYTLAFSNADDLTGTRFIIQNATRPVEKGLLGEWDTSSLSDGQYTLILAVELTSGEVLESRVDGLRVRNYTPVETNTPAPTETPAPGQAPTATSTLPPPTVTALPPNPAELPSQAIRDSVLVGAIACPLLLAALALYRYRREK